MPYFYIRNNVNLFAITLEDLELGLCRQCPSDTCPGTVLRRGEMKTADYGHTGHLSN